MAEPKVIHLIPGDVVLIGNVGGLENDSFQQTVRDIQDRLPEARVVAFVNDIDVQLLRDLTTE